MTEVVDLTVGLLEYQQLWACSSSATHQSSSYPCSSRLAVAQSDQRQIEQFLELHQSDNLYHPTFGSFGDVGHQMLSERDFVFVTDGVVSSGIVLEVAAARAGRCSSETGLEAYGLDDIVGLVFRLRIQNLQQRPY